MGRRFPFPRPPGTPRCSRARCAHLRVAARGCWHAKETLRRSTGSGPRLARTTSTLAASLYNWGKSRWRCSNERLCRASSRRNFRDEPGVRAKQVGPRKSSAGPWAPGAKLSGAPFFLSYFLFRVLGFERMAFQSVAPLLRLAAGMRLPPCSFRAFFSLPDGRVQRGLDTRGCPRPPAGARFKQRHRVSLCDGAAPVRPVRRSPPPYFQLPVPQSGGYAATRWCSRSPREQAQACDAARGETGARSRAAHCS